MMLFLEQLDLTARSSLVLHLFSQTRHRPQRPTSHLIQRLEGKEIKGKGIKGTGQLTNRKMTSLLLALHLFVDGVVLQRFLVSVKWCTS
jgi:hypothetical protein